MTATRVVFTGKQQVEYEAFEPPAVEAGQVAIRTHYSLMSTGTENIVFNRNFEPGTHWDRWVQYPFYPGYSAIGEIEEIGEGVEGFTIGQIVAARVSHASHHVTPASSCVPVPHGVDTRDAAWFALAKIAFMGAKVSDYKLGDSVLIIGAGPIGQMSVRWANAAGVGQIIVVDPVPTRLAQAHAGGATVLIDKSIADCREDVEQATGGKMPRIVNDATGNAEVFAAALGLVAKFGRVVILGDTGTPSGQFLTSDVITRGLTIVGAHDAHIDEIWNNATIPRLFFDLVKRDKFDLGGLITHTFHPQDAVQAYEIANTRRGETMGIVFDWTAI